MSARKMKIRCMFGMRIDCTMPELMVAWDEHSIDDNPAGFDEDMEKAKKSWGEDLISHRQISINIDENELAAMFEEQSISGELSKEEE
jgi:hypothetical protein